jgi:hypothetical protein
VLIADDAETAIKQCDQITVALLLTENVSRGFGCVAKPLTRAELIGRVGQDLESRATYPASPNCDLA